MPGKKTTYEKPYKPLTGYIHNVGNKGGIAGEITADLISLPLKLTATGVRGLSRGINVGKTAIMSGTKVIGNTLSNAGRDIANTIAPKSRNVKAKKSPAKKTVKK